MLGVSAKNPGRVEAYYERFITHMQDRFNLRTERALRSERWLMPWIRPGCAIDYNLGRVFFAGEAAGFLNPMGEGISAGLESGFCAACAVAEHFDNEKQAVADNWARTAKLRRYVSGALWPAWPKPLARRPAARIDGSCFEPRSGACIFAPIPVQCGYGD